VQAGIKAPAEIDVVREQVLLREARAG
jgi:sRNA-binding carbon storage regulator CsrA